MVLASPLPPRCGEGCFFLSRLYDHLAFGAHLQMSSCGDSLLTVRNWGEQEGSSSTWKLPRLSPLVEKWKRPDGARFGCWWWWWWWRDLLPTSTTELARVFAQLAHSVVSST